MGHDFLLINKDTGEKYYDPKYDAQIGYGYCDIWDCEKIQGHRSDIVAKTLIESLTKLDEEGIEEMKDYYDIRVETVDRQLMLMDHEGEEYEQLYTLSKKMHFTHLGRNLLACCRKYPLAYWFGDNALSACRKGDELYGVKPIDYKDVYQPPPQAPLFCCYQNSNDEIFLIKNSHHVKQILQEGCENVELWENIAKLLEKYDDKFVSDNKLIKSEQVNYKNKYRQYYERYVYCCYINSDDEVIEVTSTNTIRNFMNDVWSFQTEEEARFWEDMLVLMRKYDN